MFYLFIFYRSFPEAHSPSKRPKPFVMVHQSPIPQTPLREQSGKYMLQPTTTAYDLSPSLHAMMLSTMQLATLLSIQWPHLMLTWSSCSCIIESYSKSWESNSIHLTWTQEPSHLQSWWHQPTWSTESSGRARCEKCRDFLSSLHIR